MVAGRKEGRHARWRSRKRTRGGCTPVASLARAAARSAEGPGRGDSRGSEGKGCEAQAAQEEKERSSAEDQPAPEPAVQDAHQVSKDGDSGSRPTRPEAVEGEPVQDEPAQASEGDADPEVPPEGDRVSDSPPPDQVVEPLEDIPAVADESSLTTVQEDEVLEDLRVFSHPETKTAAAKADQTSESKPASWQSRTQVLEELLKWPSRMHGRPSRQQRLTWSNKCRAGSKSGLNV
jgi:hypothetical protein